MPIGRRSAGASGAVRCPALAARATPILSALAIAAALAACGPGGNSAVETPAIATPAVAITAQDLPGKWGLASYRNEEDRPRTETEAKGACGNPYTIGAGPSGGVMMHLADQSEPSELFLKVDSRGQTFLGPQGPPAVAQDRLIESYADNVIIMQWLDPAVRERYGTMLFVRCA